MDRRRTVPLTLLIAGILVVILVSGAASASPWQGSTESGVGSAVPAVKNPNDRRDDFFVPTHSSQTGFGPFEESVETSGSVQLKRALGQPSRTRRTSQYSCVLSWGNLGIAAQMAAFGGGHPSPCADGTFIQATLSDHRWHTAAGIGPGSSKGAARRKSSRFCTARRCGVSGYVFGSHRSDCSAVRSPNVIAHTGSKRVLSLVVFSHSCE